MSSYFLASQVRTWAATSSLHKRHVSKSHVVVDIFDAALLHYSFP